MSSPPVNLPFNLGTLFQRNQGPEAGVRVQPRISSDGAHASNAGPGLLATPTLPGRPLNPSTAEWSNSPLLIAIQERFPVIKNALLQNDWIVCVPLTLNTDGASLAPDREFRITEDFVSTHILRPSGSDVEAVTLNNKRVAVRDDTVQTGAGFGEPGRVCQILYDDLFVDASGHSFMVYCLDQPLEGGPDVDASRHVAESAASLGKALSDLGGSSLARIEEIVGGFNDRAAQIGDLQVLQERARDVLERSLKAVHRVGDAALAGVLRRHGLTLEQLHQMVETHVMERTYEMVYFRVTALNRREDAALRKAVQSVQYLDFSQLGLDNDPRTGFGGVLAAAVAEFDRLTTLRTPFEKLQCLLRAVQVLGRRRSGSRESLNVSLGADTLVPLMLLLVVRANGLHYASSLYYMKRFTFEHDVTLGEEGYALSSFEAVLDYVRQHLSDLQEQSDATLAFWSLVAQGATAALDEYFAEGGPEARRGVSLARDWAGDNCVLVAVRHGQLATVQHLVELQGRGFIANAENYRWDSPLHAVALVDDDERALALARYLCGLDAGLVARRNRDGATPLFAAVQHARMPLVRFLVLEAKADVSAADAQGLTALHVAGIDAARFLLEHAPGVNVNAVTRDGLSPLLFHAQHEHVDMLELLISHAPRVRVDADDLGRRTCLHLCAFRGYTAIVELLLEIPGVDVNAASMRGNTPLHAASDAGQLEIARLLLRHGADPLRTNVQGRTPGDMARDAAMRDLLDDYSLFARSPGNSVPPNSLAVLDERTAAVVRIVPHDRFRHAFLVKSGMANDVLTIMTVRRSIAEFGFLREQLLLENPSVALPELRDLLHNPVLLVRMAATDAPLPPLPLEEAGVARHRRSGSLPGSAASPSPASSAASRPAAIVPAAATTRLTSKIARRIMGRLNRFIQYLLQHPTLGKHELVWEFLMVPELDRDLVAVRTRSKLECQLEAVFDTFSPIVENLPASNERLRQLQQAMVRLTELVRGAGLQARRVGRARKEVANAIRMLRHHVGRPSLQLIAQPYAVAEALRQLGELGSDHSRVEQLDLGDAFLEHLPALAALAEPIQHHFALARDFLEAQRHALHLANDLAARDGPPVAQRSSSLGDAGASAVPPALEAAELALQRRGALVNYAGDALDREIDTVQQWNARVLGGALSSHVSAQIRASRASSAVLRQALASLATPFSTVGISEG